VDASIPNHDAGKHPPSSTSTSLIERIRARQPDAWKRLVHLYGPLVYRWSRQTGLQAADASDVVQEVFRAVAGGVASFRRAGEGDSFRGWLWTITRNKVRDHFRGRAGRAAAVGGSQMQQQLAQLPQPDPSTSERPGHHQAEVALVHRAMRAIRGEFEDPTWEAFWRMTVQGHPAAEIAVDLGMSKSAVRQAKYRVLRRLRQELQ
jgi:RNA polymerase sigma-70 factor (ECF subfamily)